MLRSHVPLVWALAILLVVMTTAAFVFASQARRETMDLRAQLATIESSLRSSLESRVKELETSLGLHVGATSGYVEGDLERLEKDLYHHIYGEFETDSAGLKPSEVARRYINALATEDWAQAFECLGEVPSDVTQAKYIEEAARTHTDLVTYSMGDFVQKSGTRATVNVSVTYRFETGDRKLDQHWAIIKLNDLWKVRWMPAQ